ncbi:MAG: response regulator [Bacteroidota bacterium]
MLTHKKILLVEDDIDDQQFFIEALKEICPEAECSIANNGIEALAHLNNDPLLPSCIFLDINMPYMNGFECLTEIKKAKAYKAIPVCVLSTSSNEASKTQSLQLGAASFISKGWNLTELKLQIDEVMQKYFGGCVQLAYV